MKTSFSHGRRLPAHLAAALATAACGLAMGGSAAHAAPKAGAGPQTLTVAMHYVVPPFVPGSKVRTAEAPDTDLAEALAGKVHTSLHALPDNTEISIFGAAAAGPANGASGPSSKSAPQADAMLRSLAPGAAVLASMQAVPTGYASQPMAIMRSDTDIKSWDQLKGRTVCLSEGGLYTGLIAARYGAIEKVFRAPADSLLALRTGGCDAAVHDKFMLDELLKLPEWKKFSAKLPPPPQSGAALNFLVPEGNPELLAAVQKLAGEWRSSHYLAALNKKRVRDIAFEVYLDQTVPDCH